MCESPNWNKTSFNVFKLWNTTSCVPDVNPTSSSIKCPTGTLVLERPLATRRQIRAGSARDDVEPERIRHPSETAQSSFI